MFSVNRHGKTVTFSIFEGERCAASKYYRVCRIRNGLGLPILYCTECNTTVTSGRQCKPTNRHVADAGIPCWVVCLFFSSVKFPLNRIFTVTHVAEICGGPQVPTFVQRPGTPHRHHNHTTLCFSRGVTPHYISKCSVAWCPCGVPRLGTKVGTCGPPY